MKSTIQRCYIFRSYIYWFFKFPISHLITGQKVVLCSCICYMLCSVKTLKNTFFIDITLQSKMEVILNLITRTKLIILFLREWKQHQLAPSLILVQLNSIFADMLLIVWVENFLFNRKL